MRNHPPLIGITVDRSRRPGVSVHLEIPETYVQAVVQAGGLPVLLPLGIDADASRKLSRRLSGILFTGGADIHPRFYHQPPHPLAHGIDEDRDRVEIDLARAAQAEGLPFLGICRGLQLVNVALGGSLYVDIPEQYSRDLNHDRHGEPARDFLAHDVRLQAGSALAHILGAESVPVNSLHHQAIRDLAPGLQATAFAPDGLIEGVELIKHPFGLAVQWHPECMLSHPPMRALFSAFVHAAGEFKKAN